MTTGAIRRIGEFILVWQLAFFLTNCSADFGELTSSESSDANESGAATITSPVVGGHISQLELDVTTPLSFDENDQGDAVLMVVSLSSNGEFQEFEIKASSSVATGPASNLRASFLANAEDADMTAALHLELLDAEMDLSANDVPPPRPLLAVKNTEQGSQRDFKVIKDFSNTDDYNTVSAKLVYESELFQIYIDERDQDKFTKADFDSLIANYENVLPLELDTFGAPSDIDDNGKFAILFTQEINAMAIHYGGLVTGFFYAIDLMDNKKYPASNEMEVFYVMVPDPKGQFTPAVPTSLAQDIIGGVMVHELQHMISFNERFFVRGLPPEEAWLNEAISHLIEDIYSANPDGYMETSGPENPSRVARYLESMVNICFVCGTTLEERGGSYLFLRYLYEQAEHGQLYKVTNGIDLLSRFLNSSERGLKNLKETAFGAPENDEDFAEFFSQFGLAVYFAGSEIRADPQLGFDGLDLRGIQDDSRGTYLNGPSLIAPTEFPFTHVMEGYSIAYIQLSPELLSQGSGHFNLIMSQPEQFQAFVIK